MRRGERCAGCEMRPSEEEGLVKLYIEVEKCCGFGECVALGPGLFRMGDDNRAELIGDGTVEEADEDVARTAAFACPAEAVLVED